MGALALGSLGVAVLVAIGGVPLALIGIGCALPLAVLVGGRSLFAVDRRADVPVVEIGLLRSMPLFSPLSAEKLEALARALERREARSGDVVIREGEDGDCFYVIAAGEVAVTSNGTAVRTLQRGDGFGEIALLHAVPRTRPARPPPTERCSPSTGTTFWAQLPVIRARPMRHNSSQRVDSRRAGRARGRTPQRGAGGSPHCVSAPPGLAPRVENRLHRIEGDAAVLGRSKRAARRR